MSFIVYNISFISILVMLYLVFYNDLYELIIVFELIMLIVDNLSEKEMIIVILGSCENVIKIIYY